MYKNNTNFSLENVEKAYNGKCGCMCGCNGDYAYAEGVERESWQGDVNMRKVKARFNKVMNDPDMKFADDGQYAYIDDGQRTTTIYFKRELSTAKKLYDMLIIDEEQKIGNFSWINAPLSREDLKEVLEQAVKAGI